MKRIMMMTILLSVFLIGKGQQVIEMNADKVTQFIFPSAISSIKGGYLPSQIMEEINDNVLYMQPVGPFPETNLNVVTADGRYFHFTLGYGKEIQKFSHIIKESDAFYSKGNMEDKSTSKPLRSSFETQNKIKSAASVNDPMEAVMAESGYLASRNSVRYKKMYLTVKGIYVHDDKLYFKLLIENQSNISYDVEMISFIVKATEKAKNATQERTSLFWNDVRGNENVISANGRSEMVFEFDKFTIGKDKVLNVSLVEKNGERSLELPIDNDWVIKAREVRL